MVSLPFPNAEAPLRPLVQPLDTPVPAPPGPQNDVILESGRDNFLNPARRSMRPLQLGDRVMSPRRQPGPAGFGGYILAFPPFTGGAFVLWDNRTVTWDTLDTLEPQSLMAPAQPMMVMEPPAEPIATRGIRRASALRTRRY